MVEGRAARHVRQYRPRGARAARASVPQEAEVRIALNDEAPASLHASPLDLDSLAVGHLVLAGRFRRRRDVDAVRAHRSRGAWVVRVTGTAHPAQPPRPALPRGPRLAPRDVHALMRGLVANAAMYREGGGVHTSAIATPEGEALLAADVGKVNTLDRLAGLAFLQGADPLGTVLLTTGRLTAAMVQRGLALGCPVLVSHSGPTTQGLDLARARGATLVGYARGSGFQVYCGARRIAQRA